MNTEVISIALIWGALAGYLAIRALDNLLALCFCLHGLLMSRWKGLAKKAATGRIRPDAILRHLLPVSLYLILFGSLLHLGDAFTRQSLRFDYEGNGALLCAAAACAMALSRLSSTRRRLVVSWRMTHEFDYAEKRRRTQLLKF